MREKAAVAVRLLFSVRRGVPAAAGGYMALRRPPAVRTGKRRRYSAARPPVPLPRLACRPTNARQKGLFGCPLTALGSLAHAHFRRESGALRYG
ncbi:hypothetical protein [Paenibacillus sp. UNC499MF]|uniref:hypothetical protein n=1 Tax=Paenibacillus sp. UNC499MF TaxID=1502751 RepID=UPI0011B0A30F|nr:hypothetical protein [Paenibacillus sp. UNC499MF]